MEIIVPRAVSVSNLKITARSRKKTQKILLSGVNFGLSEGSFVGVIGASGCDKGTLIFTLAGQVRPQEGHILLGGLARRAVAACLHRDQVSSSGFLKLPPALWMTWFVKAIGGFPGLFGGPV